MNGTPLDRANVYYALSFILFFTAAFLHLGGITVAALALHFVCVIFDLYHGGGADTWGLSP